MKKVLNIILLVLATLCVISARATGDLNVEQQNAQREALVSWVAESAHEQLSPEQSATIVDTATYYAQQRGLDPMLVLAVIRTESGFRSHAQGRGSKGLMQVQVFWHRDKLKGRSPFDPRVSIEVGTQILADCWKKFSGNPRKALSSCYNGGGDKQYYAKVEQHRRTLDRYTSRSVFETFMGKLAQARAPEQPDSPSN